MYGGGSRTTIKYKEPELDPAISDFYRVQTRLLKDQAAQAEQDKINSDAAAAALKNAASLGVGDLYNNLYNQIQQGQITGNQAAEQFRGYLSQYSLDPQEGKANQLMSAYTTEYLPKKYDKSVDVYYQEILGRAPTPEEKAQAVDRFGTVYEDVDAFKDSLLNSAEYQKKFNESQIENYWDSFYGDQITDAQGNRTGKRTFNYSDKFMPISDELASTAGLDLNKFNGPFTGTVGEIEEYTQSIRSAREYAYNAGLTNLQGDIDKELQNIKNEGSRDVARIQTEGQMAGGALAALMAF